MFFSYYYNRVYLYHFVVRICLTVYAEHDVRQVRRRPISVAQVCHLWYTSTMLYAPIV